MPACAQCQAVQNRGVTGERGKDHWIFGRDWIERDSCDGWIVKSNRADVRKNESSLRGFGGGRGDRIFQLVPCWVYRFQIETHRVRRIQADVVVRVIDAGNYCASGKIDLPRLRSGERS